MIARPDCPFPQSRESREVGGASGHDVPISSIVSCNGQIQMLKHTYQVGGASILCGEKDCASIPLYERKSVLGIGQSCGKEI